MWRAGRLIELTPTEYKLLHYLLANARRVLTRDQILEHVWDYTFAGNASVLETYISYLRHKIDDDRPAAHPHRPGRRLQPAPPARSLTIVDQRAKTTPVVSIVAARAPGRWYSPNPGLALMRPMRSTAMA